MKTKHKIALAKQAYHAVHVLRSLIGKKDVDVFRRGGTVYELDLAQGIDFSIFLLGTFEIGTTNALKKLIRPGFTAIDIGANIGAHAIDMARLVGPDGKVIACEPTQFAFEKLKRNISLNPDLADRLITLQCFLGAPEHSQIPQMIYSGWPLTGGADLHSKHLGQAQSTDRAIHQTLDEMVDAQQLSKVDVIKMDVDGFECDVLAGATRTMRQYKPVFVTEVSPYVLTERGGSLAKFLQSFKDCGYAFFDEKSERPLSMDATTLEASIGDGASANIIARVNT